MTDLPSFQKAAADLGFEQRQTLIELAEDYREQAWKATGVAMVRCGVLAELVKLGWTKEIK